jgi:predicted nucleotidyltransferase
VTDSIPRRNVILRSLRAHKTELENQGVKSLAIFGSVARGEAQRHSDIDILVEFSKPVGLFEFIGVKEYLESIVGRPVDLVTPDAIRPDMKAKIIREAVYA